jgi:hypothetical protein
MLLSSPLFHLYLLYVAALFIVFLCQGRADPKAGNSGVAPLVHGPAKCRSHVRPNDTWLPAGRFPRAWLAHEPLAFRQQGVFLSREYVARFSQAIRRVRLY